MRGNGAVTALTYTDENGFAQSDVELSHGTPDNQIRAFIDIDGTNSDYIFNFSTVKPKPIIIASPLEVRENCFVFELREENDVDVEFTSYEVLIDALYKNASFINYYIARVDSNKSVSRSFDLLPPIRLTGNSSRIIKIPFNLWIEGKTKELNKWYMGSNLEHKVILKGNDSSITIQ